MYTYKRMRDSSIGHRLVTLFLLLGVVVSRYGTVRETYKIEIRSIIEICN